MSSPTVSVIVPTYDRAAFLGEALDSLLDQRPVPDEIIVVDDGSTDDTPTVLKAYAGRIRVLRQENAGAAAARNAGAAAAHSDWLAFLDSDDLWRPGRMVQLHADLAVASPDTVAHVADVMLCGNGPSRSFFDLARIDVPAGALQPCPEPVAAFLHGFFLIGSAVRRRDFEAIGGFDLDFPTDEDTDLAHRLAARGPFLLRGDVVAEVIRREGDVSALSALRRHDPWRANDLKLRHFSGILGRDHSPREKAMARAALSDALFARAALMRGQGLPGYWATLIRGARAHSSVAKGWAKAMRHALFGAPRTHFHDRTGPG